MIPAIVIGLIAAAFAFLCAIFRFGRASDRARYMKMKRDLDLRHIERNNPK